MKLFNPKKSRVYEPSKTFAFRLLVVILSMFALAGCGESEPIDTELAGGTVKRSLFVASGSCYGGGVATTAPSQAISAFSLENGSLKRIVVDYASFSPGDSPVGIADFDSENLLVAVENTAGRRIDLVKKNGSGVTTFLTNTAALNGVLRGVARLNDGSFLVPKSTAIEKFSSSRGRITQGANPFVFTPGSTCATATTMMVATLPLANGKILYAHAAATPNNKFGLISATGYATTADCLANQSAPATTALPTTLALHPSGFLLVGYGSTTAASNSIYSYNLDQTTNVISNAASAFANPAVINGPSAMAIDPVSGNVFVASATSTFNTIERFSFNPGDGTMTSLASPIGPSLSTRCVSAMAVLEDK